MRKEGNYLLGTVSEIAEEVAKTYYNHDSNYKGIAPVDFATVSSPDEVMELDLDQVADEDAHWYGLKPIDSGFCSDLVEIVVNYYGGGNGVYKELCYDYGIKEDIQNAMIECMSCDELVTLETLLIAEWA